MVQLSALKELGLGAGEAKVYLSLVSLGEACASEIQKETGIHRTTIYDYLGKLKEKGLVSSYIASGKSHYHPTDFKNIMLHIMHKEKLAEQLIEALSKEEKKTGRLKVEVWAGNNGFRMLLNDVLQSGETDIMHLGIDQHKFDNAFPPGYTARLLEERRKKGMAEKVLTFEGESRGTSRTFAKRRHLPAKYFSPLPAMVYADRVALIVWDPKAVILIKNKTLADSYREYFDAMWRTAKQ